MHGLSLGVEHGAALRCGAVASLVAQALGTWALEVAGSRLGAITVVHGLSCSQHVGSS